MKHSSLYRSLVPVTLGIVAFTILYWPLFPTEPKADPKPLDPIQSPKASEHPPIAGNVHRMEMVFDPPLQIPSGGSAVVAMPPVQPSAMAVQNPTSPGTQEPKSAEQPPILLSADEVVDLFPDIATILETGWPQQIRFEIEQFSGAGYCTDLFVNPVTSTLEKSQMELEPANDDSNTLARSFTSRHSFPDETALSNDGDVNYTVVIYDLNGKPKNIQITWQDTMVAEGHPDLINFTKMDSGLWRAKIIFQGAGATIKIMPKGWEPQVPPNPQLQEHMRQR